MNNQPLSKIRLVGRKDRQENTVECWLCEDPIECPDFKEHMISVHLDVIESKNTQQAVGVTQPESFDEEKFENSPEPEFPVIAFDQIDDDIDDDTTVSSVKVEVRKIGGLYGIKFLAHCRL